MEDFGKGAFEKLCAHQKDDDGNQQAGYIFYAAVAERMMGVRLLPGHLKTNQCDDGGAGI